MGRAAAHSLDGSDWPSVAERTVAAYRAHLV
jgi:hypothetical protein